VFRYCIFGHYHTHEPGATGIAELPGNDFMTCLTPWPDSVLALNAGLPNGSHRLPNWLPQERARAISIVEAGTFMHELGHTLGLKHGGDDRVNFKPNYVSIMNYTFQWRNVVTRRDLDYSRQSLPTLNENGGLQEQFGFGVVYYKEGGQVARTAYSTPTAATPPATGFLTQSVWVTPSRLIGI
jgi:hypothetical protein